MSTRKSTYAINYAKRLYAIVGVPAFAFLFTFSSCKDSSTCPSSAAVQHAYYSEDYALQQTLGALQLSDFMTALHTDYHQFGWNIGTSVISSTNDTITFFFGIEYNAKEAEPYRGGAGFCDSEDGYKWMGVTNTFVETSNSPWSVKLSWSLLPSSFIKMELVSGLMGSSNAVYRLTADLIDTKGKSLKADVRLRDPFGAINQGYGTASFFPHYITPAQRAAIMNLPEHTIGAYLTATGDQMDWQGAFYYATPLMDVEQCSIEYDGVTLSGTTGKGWMDYFVKSYNAESIAMQAGSKWDWIAIQLPDETAAINVLNITNDVAGPIPYARIFDLNSERTRNGARTASHSWGIDEVLVERIGEEWISPTGVKYNMKYRVRMNSSTYPADLIVTMMRHNQSIVLSQAEGSNYQGLAWVDGTLGGKMVHGRCWVEVQPVGL